MIKKEGQDVKVKKELKCYVCPNCKKCTHGYGVVPQCKCTNPRTEMVEKQKEVSHG